MTQRFKQIKSPVEFSKMMDSISNIIPYDMDEEDLVSIIYSIMSMYVHNSDDAEYILTMCANHVKSFYDQYITKDRVQNITTVNRWQ